MSASAVAPRTAAAAVQLNMANMEDEEEQERTAKPSLAKEEYLEVDSPPPPTLTRRIEEELEEMPVEEDISRALRDEQAALVVDAQLRAMAVSVTTARTTSRARAPDTAPSTTTSTGTRSAGDSYDDVNGKDHLKPFIRTCTKFESGSGSGDQDGMISMEDGVDIAAKKRKTRRGKPKHRKLKPYSKQPLSYQQRLRCRATGRLTKTGRQPPAPYNTTQFLMEDHNDLPDLDEKIAGATTGGVVPLTAEMHASFSKPIAPPRTRDSSFSIDSDEDYFYSSPEDEEEFLTKEFSSAYEDLHAERLGALTKTELIQEYIQLEAKVDLLTKRLRSKNAASQPDDRDGSGDPKDTELAKKLKIFQQRVDELLQQNEQLRRENEMLRKQRHGSPMSSVDSESDSDSSSNEGSGCSCDHKASPGSSPVPASYHARREKTTNRRKNSSVSSVDDESDSTTGDSSCPDASYKTSTGTLTTAAVAAAAAVVALATNTTTSTTSTTTTTTSNTSNAEVANGHATNHKIGGLPT